MIVGSDVKIEKFDCSIVVLIDCYSRIVSGITCIDSDMLLF